MIKYIKEYGYFYRFRRKHWRDRVYWLDRIGNIDYDDGLILFSFDKKKVYNLLRDYPDELTQKEKEIFDKENPYWRKFFEGDSEEENNEDM